MRESLNKFILGTASVSPEEAKPVNCHEITPNPFQPRQNFSEENLAELAQSIKTYGLLQPILVRRHEKGYQLVAGERRLRACKLLGWKQIPAIIRDINDSAMAAMALIENLQRENLDFFEEAEGYRRLLEEFGLTQEVLAQRIGKSQSTIANKLRLLKLSPVVQRRLLEAGLTERHARALLKLPDNDAREKVLEKIIKLNLNVRQAESLIDGLLKDNDPGDTPVQQKFIINDFRIVMNTIRQAVAAMEQVGLKPQVSHAEYDDYFQVTIKLPK